MLNLVALFESLKQPRTSENSGDRFAACPIPGFEQSRIAKDGAGAPALLIQAKEEGSSPFVSISLEHLSVLHNVECVISHPSSPQEIGRFSVVRCVEGDKNLYLYFLRILESVVLSLGPSPSQKEITRAINILVELFRVIEEPARKSVQGFWAELLVIARASDPVVLVAAWHTNVLDVYDFNAGNQRIEVKSASGRTRQHHFGLDQLQPPKGTKVLIASVLMEQAGAGVSLAELIAEVRSHLNQHPELLVRLDQVIVATLGATWRRAFETRFDYELAKNSIRFYDANDVPKVENSEPERISNVHFKSSLNGIAHVRRSQLKAFGGLFQAAIPR